MEMNLQPLATACSVSGEPFVEGARVASFLVRSGAAMEIVRYDVLEEQAETFTPDGVLACRWVQAYKPRKQGENSDRTLKLTAESLFVTLADPTTEPTPENTRLVQFLALMLERKKILRPKGKSADGARNRFEHARSKQIFEIPGGDLTPEFFVAVQQQLSVLVGSPKAKPGGATPAPDVPASDAHAQSANSEAPIADADIATTPSAPIEEKIGNSENREIGKSEMRESGNWNPAAAEESPETSSTSQAADAKPDESQIDTPPAPANTPTGVDPEPQPPGEPDGDDTVAPDTVKREWR